MPKHVYRRICYLCRMTAIVKFKNQLISYSFPYSVVLLLILIVFPSRTIMRGNYVNAQYNNSQRPMSNAIICFKAFVSAYKY